MLLKSEQAAQMLTGKTLEGGWLVGNKLEHLDGDKGGVYSCCYEVRNGNRIGFLKAFDYSGAEKVGEDPVAYMKNLLTAFSLERGILEVCTKANCKNVVALLAHGGISVEEAKKYPKVEYLILEYAEKGDIKDVLKENNKKMEWKLRSLHQLCKGLNQIHKLQIAHQDIKPQNIVVHNIANCDVTKLSDFGSATPIQAKKDDLPKHLQEVLVGTWAYAPPEVLYGETVDDSVIRRIGCDLYLLGSMIVYYFTNANMTALIREKISPDLSWTNRVGTYGRFNEIKPHLIHAFENALQELEADIDDKDVAEKVVLMVRYLCNPDPLKRGHKKNFEELGPSQDLSRFVTMLDVLATHYWIKNK